ncbi:hypothetical protein [Haloferula sp. A504]|uniref:hypothetical protein n=1 Tax=Haloferula sp. A504 TaxID=3373601 RepID=UPI0031C031F1|nr:hypothetical protein [Verrucomicrobiaceae bacterium E54]
MKSIVSLSFVIFLVSAAASARTWTDTTGRTMEAEIVRADVHSVTVSLNGREVKIPRTKLSEADNAYCDRWLENLGTGEAVEEDMEEKEAEDKPAPDRPKVAAGEASFDGKPLITGGKVNKYDYPYDERRMAMMKKWKSEDTGFKIAIAVPHGFDPSKPQKVFIPNTAVNNAKQGLSGNFGVVGFYAKKCVENGWVCLAYDTNLGRKNHDADLYCTFEKLLEVWPNSRNWEYAVGGFSGGAKACWQPAAYLIKNDYKVIGAMLSGCNQDLSDHYRGRYKAPKAGYSDIKVHLSNGKWDEVAQVEKQEYMEKSLRRNGMRNVKKTMHDGKHNLDLNEIDIALQWFEQGG